MSTKKTAWADQQDKKLVAGDVDSEVEKVQARMKREGIKVSAQQIRNLIIEFGHSRRRIYRLIRENYAQPKAPANETSQ